VEEQSISEKMCTLKMGGAIATKAESNGTVEMRNGRGGWAVASVAERRELLHSETLQMCTPMCASPCVHICNIGVD